MLDKCVFKLLRDFAVEEIFSYELLNARKRRIFFADELHTRASTGKPRKPSSPPGLCGNGGRFPVVSEIDFRFQEGEKMAPAKARFRAPYTKNSLVWFTSIWVWKRPVSVEVSAPTRLCLQGSHVRRKFRKRTTYAAKAVP
jgi:hypothetical protein